jgi:N6-adenosine-specific RNA methylase IME4
VMKELKTDELKALRRMLARAKMPEDAIEVGAGAAGIETILRKAGLYKPEALRPSRELWLDSRCTLGRLLAKEANVQNTGPGRGKKIPGPGMFFRRERLEQLKLDKNRASESHRMGKMPDGDRKKLVYDEATKQEILPTVEMVIDAARPWWYEASRADKHKNIADNAAVAGDLGPFPLIYADPPTKFKTYSEKGLDRTPDQHYPTLTWEEVADFKVDDRLFVREIAMKRAVLFMWCTSSNLHHALGVMEAWDFEFKASAAWVKTKPDGKTIRTGTGLVFRNAHEILMYGTRGDMPGPQWQPPSAFLFPRGRHSEKPSQVRKFIERMYPDFKDERTRCELFARGTVKGWTCHGFEALSKVA